MPVYSRAEIQRTVAIVVALLLTAVTTNALARGAEPIELPYGQVRTGLATKLIDGASWLMRERWRDLEERSRRQADAAGAMIVTDFDRRPFEAAMTAIYAKAQRDPSAAELIERIRKVG